MGNILDKWLVHFWLEQSVEQTIALFVRNKLEPNKAEKAVSHPYLIIRLAKLGLDKTKRGQCYLPNLAECKKGKISIWLPKFDTIL